MIVSREVDMSGIPRALGDHTWKVERIRLHYWQTILLPDTQPLYLSRCCLPQILRRTSLFFPRGLMTRHRRHNVGSTLSLHSNLQPRSDVRWRKFFKSISMTAYKDFSALVLVWQVVRCC